MQTGVAKLKKLKGKSIREISERGRQELRKLVERSLPRTVSEMSDREFFRQIKPASRNGKGEGTAALIAGRIRSASASDKSTSDRPASKFFPSLKDRHSVARVMQQRFAAEREALIERAERAIEGRFNLLGLKDVGFGNPIDWHLEPTTGKRAPLVHWSKIAYLDPRVAGDKKVTWELNRHQHFVTLGQAYWMTGVERYAEAFAQQAAAWMDANPAGLGINWASSLEVAYRSIAWLWALHLFAGSDHLTPRFVARLLKCLIAHGRHTEAYLSRYFSPNTHLTGEALGLFYLGACLPELGRASDWRKKGLGILLGQLPVQVQSDGVYFEQATYYHRYTADIYTHLLILAQASDVELPQEAREKIVELLDYLMWITRPDGTSPLVGDDDGGRLIVFSERRPDDFRDTLATGAALFKRGDWKFIAGEAGVETLWLAGPGALADYDSIEAIPHRARARLFAQSGYFVMRDGWSKESSFVHIDCGPHGAIGGGHAHADALSIEFSAQGTTWLVDPGTFTYTADERARNEFRETAAHNTATVDGQSQSVPAGVFSWSHVAQAKTIRFINEESFDYFEGAHDGFKRLNDPVMHTRSLLFVKQSDEDPGAKLPSYLLVRDRFTACAEHVYAMRYHFAAGCEAQATGNQVLAARDGNRLSIAAFASSSLRAQIKQGWVSRCYAERAEAPVAEIEARGEGIQNFVTLLIPTKDEAARINPVRVNQDGIFGFHVERGDCLDVILIGDRASRVERASRIESERIISTGRVAWARFTGGRLTRAALIDGQTLEVKGALEFRSATAIDHCQIRVGKDCIEIVISGASEFDLALDEPISEITINKTNFVIDERLRRASFASDGQGWKLTSKDQRR